MIATLLLIPQDMASLPWDKILGGGAAGIAVLMCWLFLTHQREMRHDHNSTIEKVAQDAAGTAKEFASSMKASNEKFAETALNILREVRKPTP